MPTLDWYLVWIKQGIKTTEWHLFCICYLLAWQLPHIIKDITVATCWSEKAPAPRDHGPFEGHTVTGEETQSVWLESLSSITTLSCLSPGLAQGYGSDDASLPFLLPTYWFLLRIPGLSYTLWKWTSWCQVTISVPEGANDSLLSALQPFTFLLNQSEVSAEVLNSGQVLGIGVRAWRVQGWKKQK